MTLRDVVVCVIGGGEAAGLRAHTDAGIAVREFATARDAFAATAPADVVLVEAGCIVAPGWLERLRETAQSGATVATVSPLTQHDVELRGVEFEQAAAATASGSLRLRPRLGGAEAGGACVYVRRSALELAGDEDFFSRCVELGFAHLLADDVLVIDPGPPGRRTLPPDGPVGRAVGVARRALHGLSVVIDARILYGPFTGTHVHVLELVAALARLRGVRLTVIVPDQPNEDALARLRSLPDVMLVSYGEAVLDADIVHRPFQLTNAGDLNFLRSLGGRLIVTHQDLIAFHNPAYFPTADAWEGYRALTRLALAAADRIVFFSGHARDEALSEELVEPDRATVVHIGVDHPFLAAIADRAPVPPRGAERLAVEDVPAILCLGTDYVHKNRVFALRLLQCLRERHGWPGVLVFAGPSVAYGSSRRQEAGFLVAHREFAGSVLDVGAVTEAEKDWLFARAALVVYPSVLEGFGLVPFEAAAHRVPCLWAPGSSLSELLPDDAAEIVAWDEAQTAERALALIGDEHARERNLEAINRAAARLRWEATAAALLEVYRATADAPARAQSSEGFPLTEDAARLVGPAGELPADVHRPLLALATHPRIARPVFAALRAGYRASRRLRPAQKRR